MLALVLIVAGSITTVGDSVATAIIHLDTVATPEIGVDAYYLSVGPPGPRLSHTTLPGDSGDLGSVRLFSRQLRVTLYQCERSEWLTIDDIVLGGGGSRQLTAQYGLRLPPDLGERGICPKRAGVLRPLAGRPTVTWQSPDAFFVPHYADTLFIEHLSGDLFKITARARMDYVTNEEYSRIMDSVRVSIEASGQRGK
jgi:hypothetical protein